MKRKEIIIILAIGILLAAFNSGCSNNKKSKTKPTIVNDVKESVSKAAIQVEEKKEEVKQPEKDSDEDGIPDYLDEEANTPKGVKVDTRGRAIDSDGDGVPDYMDKEQNTPKGVKVDKDGKAIDSDGDGIPDYMDKEPNTPKGITVDSDGRAIDSDEDGIPDYLDEESNTPKGVKVDNRGIAIDTDADIIPDYLDEEPETHIKQTVEKYGSQKLIILDNIEFDSDKLTPEMLRTLDKVAEVLKSNKKLKISITGHTCDLGSKKYNNKLSKKRAIAAQKYLFTKKISKNKITIKWAGELKPTVKNNSDENRSKNRRVEILFYENETKVKRK